MPGEGEAQRKKTLAKCLPSSAPTLLIVTRHGTSDEGWSVHYFSHHHSTTADLLFDLLPVPLYIYSFTTCSLAVHLQTCKSEKNEHASSQYTTNYNLHCHHCDYYHLQCQHSENVDVVDKLVYRQSCLPSCQSMPDCKWWSLAIKHILIAPFRIISSASLKPLSSVQQPKTKPYHHEQRIVKEKRKQKKQNETCNLSVKSVAVSHWSHLYWLLTLLLLLCASPLSVSAYTNEAEQQQTSNHNGANSLHHRHKTGGQK